MGFIWNEYPILFICIVIVFAVVLALAFNYLYIVNWMKLPPGPIGLPILGRLPFLGTYPYLTFKNLSDRYGSIFHVYIGKSLVVVLNDYKSIREALTIQAENFKGRSSNANLAEAKDNVGLIFPDGSQWRQHRKFIIKELRDKARGKSGLEPLIMNEIRHFVKEIDRHSGVEIEINDLLLVSMANNIHLLLCGERLDYNHPTVAKVLELHKKSVAMSHIAALHTFIPNWITMLPGTDLLLKKKERLNIRQQFLAIVENIIENAKRKHVKGEDDNYITAFLTEKSKQNSNDNIFTDKSLLHNSRDLLAAGCDTSAIILHWALLYMTAYPDIQKKVQKEIDAVIGPEREPSYDDRMQTPFTEATICEIHRVVSLIPINLRRNLVETTLNGYHIPKDTIILPNLWAVHNDSKLWVDPENFRPERFIGQNGNVNKPAYLIPFCIGKRSCVGEPLARMELYLYFTSLLQHFTFLPVNGQQTSLEAKPCLFRVPKCSTICAVKRFPLKITDDRFESNVMPKISIQITDNKQLI